MTNSRKENKLVFPQIVLTEMLCFEECIVVSFFLPCHILFLGNIHSGVRLQVDSHWTPPLTQQWVLEQQTWLWGRAGFLNLSDPGD